jgi:phosphate transport system permease protein
VANNTVEPARIRSQGLTGVRRGRLTEHVARTTFLICAVLIVVIIFGIFIFVGSNAFSLFRYPNTGTFLSSTLWDPEGTFGTPTYGLLGFILGSVVTTLIAVIIATPLSFGMALFMTELCPRWLESLLRPLLEILNGIPSVVIGFLALGVLVPFIKETIGPSTPVPAVAGYGWGAAIVVLILMILPTIISISIDALRAVPGSVREASLALGSTRWQMMRNAIIPAATTGLGTAVILGMSRAIGEALAVSLVLKGNNNLPANLLTGAVFFQPNINITQAITGIFPEANSAERAAMFMLGFILLVISFFFICVSRYLASRSVYK